MKLIIFDCDGTLVDSQHTIVAAMTAAFLAEGLEVPERRDILGVVGLSLTVAISGLLPGGSTREVAERLTQRYKDAFAEQRQRVGTVDPLYPGLRELIEKLAARPDVLLGIATGKSERGVSAVLEREGWTRHFATVQTADDNPSKPDPAMVLRALAETGAERGNCVMIGDTMYDIDMARAAGVVAIGVGWGYQPVQDLIDAGADAIAASASELDRMLGQWLGNLESVA